MKANEVLGRMINPQQRFILVLRAPDIGVFTSVITDTIALSLESFILGYADMEESKDDKWYYADLKDKVFGDEGEVIITSFQTYEEYRMFARDPAGAFRSYSEQIAQLFEEIVEDNREQIELLYESVNIREVDVVLGNGIITLCIKGTSA